jgi:transcriptional regulator with XRE-family HTH domain
MRLSMEDLANSAGVSRSTLNRIEHDHKTRATAPKLAQFLVVLGIRPAEIRSVLKDAQYLGDVLHWMARSSAVADVKKGLQPRQALAHLTGDVGDMVAMKDGHQVTFTATGAGGLDEVRDALRASGWRVMRDA